MTTSRVLGRLYPLLMILQLAVFLSPACSSLMITTATTRPIKPLMITSPYTVVKIIQRTKRSSSLCMMTPGLVSMTMDTIRVFSKSSLSSQLQDRALSTPPLAYFLALMAAGCGVPVSEDGLCLFAGAVWSTWSLSHRINMFLALYLGVVGSDAVTFWIGRALRKGILPSFRARLQLPSDTDDTGIVKNRKRDRVRRRLERSGDWIGFVIRFSVGTRGPLMLLTGFTKQVSFLKFILGSALGGLVTLPLQLYGGHLLGHRHPAAMAGLVAGMSTFCVILAVSVAVVSWVAMLMTEVRRRQQQGNASI